MRSLSAFVWTEQLLPLCCVRRWNESAPSIKLVVTACWHRCPFSSCANSFSRTRLTTQSTWITFTASARHTRRSSPSRPEAYLRRFRWCPSTPRKPSCPQERHNQGATQIGGHPTLGTPRGRKGTPPWTGGSNSSSSNSSSSNSSPLLRRTRGPTLARHTPHPTRRRCHRVSSSTPTSMRNHATEPRSTSTGVGAAEAMEAGEARAVWLPRTGHPTSGKKRKRESHSAHQEPFAPLPDFFWFLCFTSSFLFPCFPKS